jgi:uncharacterized membrane protein (UPF0127 family)
MSRKKIQTILIILAIIVGLILLSNEQREIKGVIVDGKTFSVEIAKTEMELERGLSLHVPLKDDQGMLFIFQTGGMYGFWMKDMLFPLDIIWIDSNLQIVHIEKNLSPDSYPKIFYPGAKSLYVLEIPAGQADILQIKTGDTVKFIKK